MENDPQSALGQLNRGIDAYNNDERDKARRHFVGALLDEPENELAWLWLAETMDDSAEKRYCLDRAIQINPDSSGLPRHRALVAAGIGPAVPPIIRDLAKPQLPPSLQTSSTPRRRTLHQKLSKGKQGAGATSLASWKHPRTWLPLVVVALLLLGTAWWIFLRDADIEHETIYLAVAAPMTGDSAAIGQEVKNAALIARDDINRRTSAGPDIELVFFDDQNDPDRAVSVAQQIVADPRIVGVVGHSTSTTSLAAAPIYAAANMPVVSGQATIDTLSEYPNYFRTIYSNLDAATILSQYLRVDLGQDRASIVGGNSDFETSLANDFASVFAQKGTVAHTWTIGDDREASVASIVEAMQKTDDMGALFMAVTGDNGYELLLQLRDAGLDPIVVAPETIGTAAFAKRFAYQANERKTPGFYTHKLYAVSPLLFDSVGGATLAFSSKYKDAYRMTPDWRAPKIWDAVTALVTAASRGEVTSGTGETDQHRATIVRELAAMKSPETGFQGLAGPVFFVDGGRSPQGLSVGIFTDGRLGSAPVQYRMVDNLTSYDIDAEVAANNAIVLGGYYVHRYRVAYVGIEMIELRELSSANQSFKADFYIYFRYSGNDDPLNIMFTNATDPGLSLGEPLTSSVTKGGMNYRLYRVQGTFNEPMDFSDYPWDEHELTIRFQNPSLTQNDLVYVSDPAALAMSQEERLQSGFDLSRSFNRVPSWFVNSVLYQQSAIASTANAYDTDGVVYYSEYRVAIDTQRDVNAFLMKNMLPLLLLTLVTYIAIWFPAEQAGARVGFAITALLSSAVMLNAISSQLPDIGYNVAIEWGYYAYIGLSALLVLLTIGVQRAHSAKRFGRVRRLDRFLRIVYPATIAAVMLLYFFVYRPGHRTSGGEDDVRAGVLIVTAILFLLSTAVVFFPDHLHRRPVLDELEVKAAALLEPEIGDSAA